MIRKHIPRPQARLVVAMAAFILAFGIPVTGAANQDDITSRDGTWIHEDEFDADETLHARSGQAVVYELEQGKKNGGGKKSKPGLNTSRLFVEETGDYEFCIPANEPHIVRLKLREGRKGNGMARGRTVLQVRPGETCRTTTLDPGSYVVDTFHDHRKVPEGKVAFMRFPNEATFEGDELSAATATWSLLAWRSPDGKFVRAPNGTGDIVANATTVDEYAVFKMTQVKDGWKMADGAGNGLQNQTPPQPRPPVCPAQLFTGDPRGQTPGSSCPSKFNTFTFFTKSSAPNLFVLSAKDTAWSEDGIWGYDASFFFNTSTRTVDSTNDVTGNGTRFTKDFQGFTCTGDVCNASNLNLQQGQVALFSEENFNGTAFVFRIDVPNLGIYNAADAKGLAIGNNKAKSVRVGPNTLALLYTSASYGGTPLATAADIASLDDPTLPIPIGNSTLSSIQIKQTNSYIVDSNGCANCDLSGIDLNGKDLSGTDFSNSVLTGADLTNTSLFSANLDAALIDKATLSGTDLLETSLRCTTLSDSDLTEASFALENGALAAVADSVSVLSVEPESGNRSQISTGTGGAWNALRGIGQSSEGVFAAVALDLNIEGALAKVIDDNRVSLSYCDTTTNPPINLGEGPCLVVPVDVAEESDGSVIVVDVAERAVFRVDPSTGDRTIISDRTIGKGTNFLELNSVDIGADGTIYVVDVLRAAVMAVSPRTGDRTIVSDADNGTGQMFQQPAYIDVAPDGSLLVTDSTIPALLRVDPTTGDRTLISSSDTGDGVAFVTPAGVTSSFDGSILVADAGLQAIIDVDPATGDRTVISDASTGTGVAFQQITDIASTDTAALTTRLATDFSCRLSLARSTFNLSSVPPKTWRYLNLAGATVKGAAGATLSTRDEPVDFSGAVLNALNLAGAVLDGGNFNCASVNNGAKTFCSEGVSDTANGSVCTCLQGAQLQGASLRHTNFTSAILWGALLGRSNLDFAVMSNAQLRARSDGFTGAADLSSAFMRNVQLDGADLTSVTANNVNFYTVPSNTTSATAYANGATMTGMVFDDAYLAGADFGGAALQSTSWERAILTGANFEGALLQVNPDGGSRTRFNSAFMHGAVFISANVEGAFFTNTYWDLDQFDDKVLNVQVPIGNLQFSGYWKDTSELECVSSPYPSDDFSPPSPPSTDSSNQCPDGTSPPGGCTFQEDPLQPIEDAIPTTSVCTQDDVMEGTCVLPSNATRTCAEIDSCWISDEECPPG